MTTWIAAPNLKGPGYTLWHVGVERPAYTEVTRRRVDKHLVTLCTGRQLGGPYGYSRIPNSEAQALGDHEVCKRCLASLARRQRDFRRQARAHFKARWYSTTALTARDSIAATTGQSSKRLAGVATIVEETAPESIDRAAYLERLRKELGPIRMRDAHVDAAYRTAAVGAHQEGRVL